MKRTALFLIVAACWASQPLAQNYPNKPVRVVIGYAPGGSADAGIRPLARVLEPLLGRPLIIENKPGNAGGGPAMTDLMGGQVPMLFSSLGPAVGAVKGGKIRALAVTSLTRSAAFPDVPTMDELGLKGFESTAWYGLLGPAGLPPEVVSRWTQALAKAAGDKAGMDAINATGCDVNILSPARTVERIKADSEKWGRVVRDANIRAD